MRHALYIGYLAAIALATVAVFIVALALTTPGPQAAEPVRCMTVSTLEGGIYEACAAPPMERQPVCANIMGGELECSTAP